MIDLRSPEEVRVIGDGGRITAFILKKILAAAEPGVRTIELENLAVSLLDKFSVQASFKTVKGYSFALCLSLNEEVVHGLPGERRLKKGDLLTVDFGVLYKSFHSDMARTILVGGEKGGAMGKFLAVGKEAFQEAISQAKIGNRVGHLSQAIERVVKKSGYQPIEGLVGHGVGKKLHEDPQIPCLLIGKLEETPRLEDGMVLAIEVMYTQGKGEIKIEDWTAVTADGSLAAHFENTVAVTKGGPVVLTK